MSLYKVGGIWYIDVRVGPRKAKRRVRESTGTADREAAQEFHDRVKGESWRQVHLNEAPRVSWDAACKKWLALKERGMPDRYRLRALAVPITAYLPLTKAQIDAALVPYAKATYNRVLALIVAVHSASGAKCPKIDRMEAPKGRTRWLTAEEWKRLKGKLQKTSPLLAQAAEFSLATGLRENNVLGLEWSQVDMRRRVAWIYADQFKTGEPHGIPLTDGAMAILEARRGIDATLVFGNPDYALYKASNRAWYDALKAAKLYKTGVNWHTLRHTWASWAVMSGVRLDELMELGGWKSYSMVRRYAHLSPEHLASVAAKVKPVSRGRMRGHQAKVRT